MLKKYGFTIIFADETAVYQEVYSHSDSEAVDALMHLYMMDDGSFPTVIGVVNTLDRIRLPVKETANA
jgi:hypothetical protein